jgi:transposase
MTSARKPYPFDVSDEEWALVAPYLTLLPEEAGQREHSLREVFNGLRYIIKTGAPWRWMPNDLPPWAAVYQQAQRWLNTGCFEELAHDLRAVLRLAAGRAEEPSAAVLDSRTLRSSPESGARAGYDGAKCKKGSKLHMAGTPSVTFWPPTSHPPRLTITLKWDSRPKLFRWPPARAWIWPMWIRATPVRGRRMQPGSMGLSWRWSSCLRPSAASC